MQGVVPIRRTRRGAGAAGYTIVELLMVMAIIAIIAGITYVRVAPSIQRAQVRGAANVLAGDLQYAQVLAARFGVPMVLTVNSSLREYTIADRAGDSVYRLRRFGADGDYAIGEFTATPTSVQLFPSAMINQSATYTLGIDGYKKRVVLTLAGQVRVQNVP